MDILQLTIPELVCLGRIMGAETLESGYLDALGEPIERFSSHEPALRAALAERGLIRLFLSGRATVQPETEKRLKPVFFCRRCSALDMCRLTPGAQSADLTRLHFYEGECTCVRIDGDMLKINAAQREELERLLACFIPKSAVRGDGQPQPTEITTLIAAKDLRTEGMSTQRHFALCGDQLYELSGESLVGAEPAAAMDAVMNTIW